MALSKDKVKGLFSKAKEQVKEGFDNAVPGTYTAKLVICALHESKKGKLSVKHGWKILEGEYEGKTWYDYRGVETEVGLSMLISEWGKLGVDKEGLNDFDDVEATAKEIEDAVFVCQVKISQNRTNPEFLNWYIVNVLGQESDAESEGEDAPAPVQEAESEEEGDDELSVGRKVNFKKARKTFVGTVVEINEEDELVSIKTDDGKVHEVALEAIESFVD